MEPSQDFPSLSAKLPDTFLKDNAFHAYAVPVAKLGAALCS
jgi:hypothetical protein